MQNGDQMKFRKKPVEVEAINWTGKNLDEVLDFCEGSATYEAMSSGGGSIVIETLESSKELKTRHSASIGDWIIKGVKGEFYPCKPDIFEQTYENSGNNSTIGKKFVDELNKYFKKDAKCISELFEKSVGVNKELSEDENIVVRNEEDGEISLGVIGLLNGILVCLGEGKIAIRVDNKTNKLLGFVEYNK